MSAREELAAVLKLRGLRANEIDALLAAHRAEVLRDAADRLVAFDRAGEAHLLRRMADEPEGGAR
jgi:hypothetical protein